ncbi:MAG: hypothetical protein K2X01_03155 [Cyanobacteria bacterium]|nr:hypothetical protein [Cyanobacteriota bacterium]
MITFGKTYEYYQQNNAERKQRQLNKLGIPNALEVSSSQGMLTVMRYLVHTNQGTPDLDQFMSRQQKP